MATCEITTYDPEPTFELPYENDHTWDAMLFAIDIC
jgi:hypothetical protein